MPKRRKSEATEEADEATPRKSRRIAKQDDDTEEVATPSQISATPSKRKSILRGTPSKINGASEAEPTPKGTRRVLFSTPKVVEAETLLVSAPKGVAVHRGQTAQEETQKSRRNDQSARRKSARALQKQTGDDDSEGEDALNNASLAKEILAEEDSEADSGEIELEPTSSTTNTPAKRGRPKGKRRERTPSPPPDLPPHELYFFQNRTGANKTSSNTLSPHLLLNHEEYFTHINAYNDPHETDIKRLRQYHKRAFDQWIFELQEGFNVCLYGYGSKRELVMEFAELMYLQEEKPPKIVVVNGYTPGLTVRDILTTIASVVLPKNTRLPAQPGPLLDMIQAAYSDKPPKATIRLVIHSLDHTNLRKPATQALIARLASTDNISLLATCDSPNFALLWDATLLRQFRWLYHDATTMQPYKVELDVVEEVNALLGRSGRRLGGKDGVGYVLKSLPENARNLFRILVAEQLALADVEPDARGGDSGDGFVDDEILGAEDEEEAALEQDTPSRRGRGKKSKVIKVPKPTVTHPEGVEYRTLYHKAVEDFVCSSELNFRTLLKEFHDHQMIDSRRDAMGTERLVVPFRREELESILEDLV